MDHERADRDVWAAAERRAAVLGKLPERPSEAAVRTACATLEVSRATLFRWLKRYRDTGRTSALLPRRRGPPQAMEPLVPEVLAVVERHFQDFYATERRPTRTRLWREIGADCRQEGLKPPSIRRLGRWLALQDQAELLRRREGKGKSEPVFLATPGTLRADAPLDIVQIDHTKVDVTVVDPASRKPIGRPTLTLAIDVATRMATGFHLSLEPPCLTSVALCLTHAVMDKSGWLAARDIAAEWPARGIPRVIHVDNGAEFHALAFERACAEHGVDLTYRPPGTPRFGGHIERLIGTRVGGLAHARDRRRLSRAGSSLSLRPAERGLGGRYRCRASADADGPAPVPDGLPPDRTTRAAARRASSLQHSILVGRAPAADGAGRKGHDQV